MKKKLLFVIPNLQMGGAEKSLVNLLQEMDFTKYDVDLFLMSHTGALIDQIPGEVHILPESENFKIFSGRYYKALLNFLIWGKWNLAFKKLQIILLNILKKNGVASEQLGWKYLKYFFPPLSKKYDVAIGYLEKNANYIAADCTTASKKIGWIHTDLEQMGVDFNLENDHFSKLDHIVTVSEGLSGRLRHMIPQFAAKIVTIENINSVQIIRQKAAEEMQVSFEDGFTNLVFVGRLEKVKGLEVAIEACKILINEGEQVRLYLIGDGSEKEYLEQTAVSLNICDHIFFIGMVSNPYPYLQNADVFIMTSHYEGKSISLEEAKILCKPIVITNFSSAKDQIEDNITGLIAEQHSFSVADRLSQIIHDHKLRDKLVLNLQNCSDNTENEVQKLYNLIDSK